MNKLKFNRTNGNVPKTLPGNDHISGLLYYLGNSDELPKGFSTTQRIQLVSSIESAEKLGITADADNWNIKNLHFQLTCIFAKNPGITLYLGLFNNPSKTDGEEEATPLFSEIKTMQNFAGGDIRQIGVYRGNNTLKAAELTNLQAVATKLEEEDMPLVILYAPKVANVTSLTSTVWAGENKKNVSVVIGQDMDGTAAALQKDKMSASAVVTGLGTVLGLVSAASVHESISWVQKFPTGVALPGFCDGTTELRSLDKGIIDKLDECRFIFFRTYGGLAGSYINDSHNMDSAISDYNTIESVRTMDKAVRGIRTYLLPELGSPLYIDPETGKMSPETVAHLQTVANYQLEDMKKAGELSGYVVEIDPEQNVLASSTVEFVIKNVAVGVFRKGVVNIGYALSV